MRTHLRAAFSRMTSRWSNSSHLMSHRACHYGMNNLIHLFIANLGCYNYPEWDIDEDSNSIISTSFFTISKQPSLLQKADILFVAFCTRY